MARLLTLALAEATRRESDYSVVAWNLDTNSWVLIKQLPIKSFKDKSGNPIWDIFGITEAEIEHITGKRPEVSRIDSGCKQYYVDLITDYDKRIGLLEKIVVTSIENDVYHGPNWVGLVKVNEVIDLNISKRHENQRSYNPERTFFWNNRIIFLDGTNHKWNSPCKDLRWKKYWLEQIYHNGRNQLDIKNRWINYLNNNYTFFIVEIYPPWKGPGVFRDGAGHYFGICGILSIPK
jgi:hypothetical protein